MQWSAVHLSGPVDLMLHEDQVLIPQRSHCLPTHDICQLIEVSVRWWQAYLSDITSVMQWWAVRLCGLAEPMLHRVLVQFH